MAREEAREIGLSLPQLFLLGGLRERGPMPVSRWVQMVGASPSATTSLLDGLEDGGYIARAHDTEDRRQVLISLTPKGLRFAERVRAEYRRRWASYCEGISPGQLDGATRVLDRILAAMGASGAVPLGVARPRRIRRASA